MGLNAWFVIGRPAFLDCRESANQSSWDSMPEEMIERVIRYSTMSKTATT